MSWNLEVDVDLFEVDGGLELVGILAAYLEGDINQIEVEVSQGSWDRQVVFETVLDDFDIYRELLAPYHEQLRQGEILIETRLKLDAVEYDAAWPRPVIQLFGKKHPGRTLRRRSDAVLEFGNRKAYDGSVTLGSGCVLVEEFVISALIQICKELNPRNLFLHAEETISYPINYHFVYHDSMGGYLDDLTEIIHISDSGGQGYDDGRSSYPPALSDINGETMMFAKRSGEWLDSVKRFLAAKVSRLKAQNLPQVAERSFIESVLVACNDIDFFFTESGLGIYGLPPLQMYVEGFYLEMMEQLSPRPES